MDTVFLIISTTLYETHKLENMKQGQTPKCHWDILCSWKLPMLITLVVWQLLFWVMKTKQNWSFLEHPEGSGQHKPAVWRCQHFCHSIHNLILFGGILGSVAYFHQALSRHSLVLNSKLSQEFRTVKVYIYFTWETHLFVDATDFVCRALTEVSTEVPPFQSVFSDFFSLTFFLMFSEIKHLTF